MPNPGQGPGSDPPDDMGPSEEEVEDLAGGPGLDVSGDAFSQKVIKRLKEIRREEDRLGVLQAEHKAFRAKYCQAWSKNRTAMKPELLELEEKVKRQTLLLEKLKARSGAFKEKFDNDQRFANQQSPSTSSADQPVTDSPAPSASAPLPPDQDWESPVATSQEVEGEGGILTFIKQMESPLRADRLVFADEVEEIPEDERPCKPAKPVAVERSCYTKMDPSSMLSGKITDKMAADSKDTAMIPTEHQGMAAVEGGGDVQCVEASMDISVGPAVRNVMSAGPAPSGSAASEKPVTPEDRTSAVSMNTAVKSAELCPLPTMDSTDRAEDLQEAGGNIA